VRSGGGRAARSLVSSLLVLLVAFAGCASTARRDAPPSTATPRPGTAPLRVGTSGDYPPFSVRDASGAWTGFDVAVARAYASDGGRELELVPFTWPDLQRRFLAGDFDVVMSGVTVRGDRLALAPMTTAVARASAVLVVPAQRTAPVPDDGRGLRVAVNRGGHLERVTRATLPRATVETLDDNRSLPAVLASGRVDGVVTDSLELASFAAHGGVEPRVARILSRDRKAYWVSPRDPALAASLDAWLLAREADGTLARLRTTYLGGAGGPPADSGAAAALRVADLVARRLLLMPEVAAAKRAAGLPVDVPGREGEVFARARTAAERDGLAAEPYLALVRAQIEAAKVVQYAVLALPDPGPPATPEAAARARERLDAEIRPAIDRLDAAIRQALVMSAPLRLPVAQLSSALAADAPVPGFDARQASLLAAALAEIPAATQRSSAEKIRLSPGSGAA
jgi:cyclohexadienyl dehydratase